MTTANAGALIILDGWGINYHRKANAVQLAAVPCLDQLQQACHCTRLQCAGEAVDLAGGIMELHQPQEITGTSPIESQRKNHHGRSAETV